MRNRQKFDEGDRVRLKSDADWSIYSERDQELCRQLQESRAVGCVWEYDPDDKSGFELDYYVRFPTTRGLYFRADELEMDLDEDEADDA